ncbi:MAG: winged helix DNA-binding protein [Candidatus Marsarchaeota archaeon]|jgi:DNA-binding MarR family transcriptional regulator|nr:winged helix DNA-binding protein [Candidatus Marsarchaeota archaeon]MCL5418517.1 winged helix DNA-binding protein [Candidatus Marsarchaeota archaeon]
MKVDKSIQPLAPVHTEDNSKEKLVKYTNPAIAAHVLHFLRSEEKRTKDIVNEIVSNPNMPSVSSSHVHLIIKQLSSNGLIRRSSDSSKRMTMYELTEDGKNEVETSIEKSKEKGHKP